MEDNNFTVLEGLQKLFPDCSNTTIRSFLKEGRVTLDGEICKIGSLKITSKQQLKLGPKLGPKLDGLQILYEDNDIVVVDKPSGLLSVAANFNKTKTAHAILKEYYRPNKVFVVHRIDQDTSGVMLFALSEKAYHKLKKTFEEHDIIREYIAVLEGPLTPSKNTWQSYLYEDANYHVHETSDPVVGKLAITHYEVIKKTNKYSLVKFTLETGRKNQIRVQASSHEHPIVGDMKYGAMSDRIGRLGLHAHRLNFDHPVTGKKMFFDSPIPEKFKKLVY